MTRCNFSEQVRETERKQVICHLPRDRWPMLCLFFSVRTGTRQAIRTQRMAATEQTPRESSDSALMLSYRAGDEQGFDMLYERHKNPIYRFFYFGTGGDRTLAGELFQDVWMTVVRGRMRYNKNISFTDWLHHVAWARLYDHIRLHPQTEFGPVESEQSEIFRSVEPVSNVVALYPHSETKVEPSDLLSQLKRLSDEHREIVLLRYCFRMSFTEIAQFLDVARSAVNRLHREALVSLRSAETGVG